MSEGDLFDSVLLLEDDPAHTLLIKRALKGLAGTVHHAALVSEALSLLEHCEPDIIITDLNVPDSSSVAHVETFRKKSGDCPVVVLTSAASIESAVEAMKLGASDFIVKDFNKNFHDVLHLSLTRVFSAQQLEQERLRLQREMEKLRMAIENSNDGLAVVDQFGKVRYANSAFQSFVRLCDGNAEDLVSICTDRVSKGASLRAGLVRHLAELSKGAFWRTEVTFAEEGAQAFDLSLSAIYEDSSLDLSRDCVVWVRDVTEQKRREKFQREILSTTTHDLKGPLGAIITGSELVSQLVEGQEKPSQLIVRVISSAQGAVNLIDEFLSARRIEEGNFVLKPVLVSLRDLLEDVRGNFETIAVARSIQLEFDIEDEDFEIRVDKLGFSRVLSNLLSNALKFTPKSGTVWVRARSDHDGLHIGVQDTGSGMEPADVRRVFERYSRLERHTHVKGTGIGLFVVKSIVEAHGGSIDVTSKVGEGTLFDVTFPFEPPVNERGELICLDFA